MNVPVRFLQFKKKILSAYKTTGLEVMPFVHMLWYNMIIYDEAYWSKVTTMLHHSYLKAVGKVTPYLAAPGCGVFQLNNKLCGSCLLPKHVQ